VQIQRLWL